MAGYSIGLVDGLADDDVGRLRALGLRTTHSFLEKAKDPKGRREIAQATGLEEKIVLRLANLCDLMRIRGVARENAELLEAAGVETVRSLRHRNAANLTKALIALHAERSKTWPKPSRKAVERWIAEAKTLPPTLIY